MHTSLGPAAPAPGPGGGAPIGAVGAPPEVTCGWLDANDWQDNYYGNTREHHLLDQYGAELDGPVRIPKVYNGLDKLFFVAQFENYNELVPSTSVQSVPSAQWLQGDFSNLVQWNGDPITIYDSLTLHQTGVDSSGNPVYARDPFSGNKIPSGRLNPLAQSLVKYFPAPNVTVPFITIVLTELLVTVPTMFAAASPLFVTSAVYV